MDRRVRGWQVIAAVAVVGTVGALLPALWKKDRTPPGGLTRPVPLTVFPGNETDPSFSPDGRSLAFIWDGDLYRISVEGSSPRRLTKTEQTEADPAWSRDDRSIAFLRRASDGTSSLILMDREGGKERRIVSFRAHDGLTWTPDGRWLLASRRETETSPYAIVLVDPTTGEIHPLSRPAPDSFGDRSPSISPTGRTVAAVRGSTAESGGIVLLRLEGNPPTAIQCRTGRSALPRGRRMAVTWCSRPQTGRGLGCGVWRWVPRGRRCGSGSWGRLAETPHSRGPGNF
jgi:dipeptidyl aminopeptidase/acylaminoacyl peptidase